MSSYGNGWQEILLQNSFTSADVKLDVLKKAKFKKKKKKKEAFKTRDMTNEGSGKKIKPKKNLPES